MKEPELKPRRKRWNSWTLTPEKVEAGLDWAYRQAIHGELPFVQSVEDYAKDYRERADSVEDAVDSLIRNQVAKASTTGFLTGLGGLIVLPVTLPANLTTVLLIQLRMIGAIAYMCGYDPKTDQVQTALYMCLVGNAAKEVAGQVGINIGKKMAMNGVKAIPGKTLIQVNKKVCFRLFTKFGQKGPVNLGKMVPLAGGAVGATVDGLSTYAVGKAAKRLFVGSIDRVD